MKNKKYAPFAIFCAVILLFYLLFTRLIIKTDDGHFWEYSMSTASIWRNG